MLQEKCQQFVRELFQQWEAKQCRHMVTMVLFARAGYSPLDPDDPAPLPDGVLLGGDGIAYRDYYRVVADQIQTADGADLHDLRYKLMQGLGSFMDLLEAATPNGWCFEGSTSAARGNLLEAMNMSLNALDRCGLQFP